MAVGGGLPGPGGAAVSAYTAATILYTQTLPHRNLFFYKNRASAHIFAPFCPAEKPRRGRMPREYSETFSSPAPAQSQPPQAAQSPSSGAGAAPPIFAPPSAGSMASATFSISAHSMRLQNSLQPYS